MDHPFPPILVNIGYIYGLYMLCIGILGYRPIGTLVQYWFLRRAPKSRVFGLILAVYASFAIVQSYLLNHHFGLLPLII